MQRGIRRLEWINEHKITAVAMRQRHTYNHFFMALRFMQESRVLHLRNPPVFSRLGPTCVLIHGQEADSRTGSGKHSKSSAMGGIVRTKT